MRTDFIVSIWISRVGELAVVTASPVEMEVTINMGRVHRVKRQKHLDDFPFKLLHAWIRPYTPVGQFCKCNRPVAYVFEHYIDSVKMQLLISLGSPEAEAVNVVWEQAVREQRRGKYRMYRSTYRCRECCMSALGPYSRSDGGTLAIIPDTTILAGVTLQSIDDDGKTFAACAVAYSIEEVARQLRSEEFAINLK
jgi:hypothetical protein